MNDSNLLDGDGGGGPAVVANHPLLTSRLPISPNTRQQLMNMQLMRDFPSASNAPFPPTLVDSGPNFDFSLGSQLHTEQNNNEWLLSNGNTSTFDPQRLQVNNNRNPDATLIESVLAQIADVKDDLQQNFDKVLNKLEALEETVRQLHSHGSNEDHTNTQDQRLNLSSIGAASAIAQPTQAFSNLLPPLDSLNGHKIDYNSDLLSHLMELPIPTLSGDIRAPDAPLADAASYSKERVEVSASGAAPSDHVNNVNPLSHGLESIDLPFTLPNSPAPQNLEPFTGIGTTKHDESPSKDARVIDSRPPELLYVAPGALYDGFAKPDLQNGKESHIHIRDEQAYQAGKTPPGSSASPTQQVHQAESNTKDMGLYAMKGVPPKNKKRKCYGGAKGKETGPVIDRPKPKLPKLKKESVDQMSKQQLLSVAITRIQRNGEQISVIEKDLIYIDIAGMRPVRERVKGAIEKMWPKESLGFRTSMAHLLFVRTSMLSEKDQRIYIGHSWVPFSRGHVEALQRSALEQEPNTDETADPMLTYILCAAAEGGLEAVQDFLDSTPLK